MGPRANYECRIKCQAVYEDLPVTSTRCPVCGFRRGFRRLYDSVNVSTNGHKVAKVIDPLLGPTMNQHAMRQDEVKAAESRITTERDMMYEKANEVQRQAIAEHGPPLQWQGARQYGQGLTVGPGLLNQGAPGHLAIPAEARAASAWPFIKRRVVPSRPF